MSQIIITGTPQFDDVKLLIDMLPISDRIALKKYLENFEDLKWQQKFNRILAGFRNHNYENQEIKKDVEQAIAEVRSARKNKSI